MIPKDNEFNNGERAVIFNTTGKTLDGVEVVVNGVAVDFSPLYRIYIVSRSDGGLWANGYTSVALTSRCLKPV